jgi:hypothetical protein
MCQEMTEPTKFADRGLLPKKIGPAERSSRPWLGELTVIRWKEMAQLVPASTPSASWELRFYPSAG